MTRPGTTQSAGDTVLDFRQLFTAHREAFCVAGLPAYRRPGDRVSLARFRRTGIAQPPSRDWLTALAAARDAGTTVRRLRLISTPLTEYEAWELRVFAHHLAAGEQIRVLPRDRLPYRHGLWIFDQTVAYWMIHDPAGGFVRAKVRPADAACQYWRRRYDQTAETPADYLIAAASSH